MRDAEESAGLVDERAPSPSQGPPESRSKYEYVSAWSRRRWTLLALLLFTAFFFIGMSSSSIRNKESKQDAQNSLPDSSGIDPLLDEDEREQIDEATEQEMEEQSEGEALTEGRDDENGNEQASSDKPDSEGTQGNEVITMDYFISECERLGAQRDKLSQVDYAVAAADCGWGYDFRNSSAKIKPWKVVLLGPGWAPEIVSLSGCPARCPNSPKCVIEKFAHFVPDVNNADLVVVFQTDANAIVGKLKGKKSNGQRQYKVIYWREAVFTWPSVPTQKRFDFEMGVHYYSGLLNPMFLRKPGQYLSGAIYPYPPVAFIPPEKREYFSMSMISHCGSNSQRDLYLERLVSVLGGERVHRYGSCGDRKMPGHTINIALKLMAQYKFYLSFENTIQDGYVTEKLFFTLNAPILPVYLGALNVPNITTTPSFIKVSEFGSPKALADYLLYLEANPSEYMKYHTWRTNPSSFTKEYLDILSNRVAGPEEMEYFRKAGFKRFPRTSHCCRLCDENFVKFAADSRTPISLVNHRMGKGDIDKRFFNDHASTV